MANNEIEKVRTEQVAERRARADRRRIEDLRHGVRSLLNACEEFSNPSTKSSCFPPGISAPDREQLEKDPLWLEARERVDIRSKEWPGANLGFSQGWVVPMETLASVLREVPEASGLRTVSPWTSELRVMHGLFLRLLDPCDEPGRKVRNELAARDLADLRAACEPSLGEKEACPSGERFGLRLYFRWLRAELERVWSPPASDPAPVIGLAAEVPHSSRSHASVSAAPSSAGYLSVKDLADRHHVDAEALRKRLGRWRARNPGGRFLENTERRSKEPLFLYEETAVLAAIEDLRGASGTASDKRPAS